MSCDLVAAPTQNIQAFTNLGYKKDTPPTLGLAPLFVANNHPGPQLLAQAVAKEKKSVAGAPAAQRGSILKSRSCPQKQPCSGILQSRHVSLPQQTQSAFEQQQQHKEKHTVLQQLHVQYQQQQTYTEPQHVQSALASAKDWQHQQILEHTQRQQQLQQLHLQQLQKKTLLSHRQLQHKETQHQQQKEEQQKNHQHHHQHRSIINGLQVLCGYIISCHSIVFVIFIGPLSVGPRGIFAVCSRCVAFKARARTAAAGS